MLEKLPDAVGHLLRNHRAGLEKIAFQKIDLRSGTSALVVTSAAFVDHGAIPVQCTADGAALSPPLQWAGVPADATSLVLIVEDADSPTPQPLVHAIAVGLPPRDDALPEGALKSPDHEAECDLNTGRNSYLMQSWLPPDPPPGHGTHRYAFQVFALGGEPSFEDAPGRGEVLDILRAHALASGCLIGTYERDNTVKIENDRLEPLAVPMQAI